MEEIKTLLKVLRKLMSDKNNQLFLSWTPYAAVTFYSAFIADNLPPLAGTLPAMFAKSAFVWSSAIFLYSSKAARKALFGKEDMVSHSYASGSRTDQQSRGKFILLF